MEARFKSSTSSETGRGGGKFVKGIQFLTDEKGEKTAVQIDLDRYGEIWEDMYDTIMADQRRNEPRESLESVKKHLRKLGKLRG